MANLIIATPIVSDDGTLTAGSAAAGLPVSNLVDIQPGNKWRATALASAWCQNDLGAAKAVDLVALLYTNATSTAQWRIRAANSVASVTSNPDYNSGLLTFWPTTGLETWDFTHGIHWIASTQTYRVWRIDVSDSSNPDTYFEAGRWYISDAFQPTQNMQYGVALAWNDESPKPKSLGGQIVPVVRNQSRIADLRLSFIDEAEMYSNIFEIERRRGASKDVLVIFDPVASARLMDQTIYGLMETRNPIVNRAFEVFEKRIRIEEMPQ